MAHFKAGCRGGRGEATRLGHGVTIAYVNGWGAGAKIVAVPERGGDVFHIYSTSGSLGGYNDRIIGTIRNGRFKKGDDKVEEG